MNVRISDVSIWNLLSDFVNSSFLQKSMDEQAHRARPMGLFLGQRDHCPNGTLWRASTFFVLRYC